jgi:hypothetical protein
MMNKILGFLSVIYCILSIQFTVSAQSVVMVNNNSLLYSYYPNEIKLGFTQAVPENFHVSCDNCDTLYKSKEEDLTYIVYPSKGSSCHLIIYDSNSEDSIISEHYFMVRNVPKPTLKFGACWDGSITGAVYSRLFIQYYPTLQLKSNFKIKSWQIKVGNEVYEGDNSTITEHIVSILKNLKTDTALNIVVKYIGQDLEQEVKTLEGNFTVRKKSDQRNIPNEYSGNCE